MILAPVGISTYCRKKHLEQTINALKKNILAKKTEIFIFSDAPQEGDEEKVTKVREYIHTVKGFRKVHIIERMSNSRTENNRLGIKQLLDMYGKVIWLEEDIVTAPGFLSFMNNALSFYQNDRRVFSITGYTMPITIPMDKKSDVFTLQRFNAWGFATWKERFDKLKLQISKDDYLKNVSNRKFYKSLKSNGEDIPLMVEKDVEGKIDALDVKIMYQQIKNDWYTIYPRISLVQNIGHDGTGTHCKKNMRFYHNKLWEKRDDFVFKRDIKINYNIVKANYKFRKYSLRIKIGLLLRKFLINRKD